MSNENSHFLEAQKWRRYGLLPSLSFPSLSLADPELQFRGPHGERGARAYNGGLGRSPQRGPGAKPLVRGSWGEAPEAESVLALGRPTDTANLNPWPVAVFSV